MLDALFPDLLGASPMTPMSYTTPNMWNGVAYGDAVIQKEHVPSHFNQPTQSLS